MLFILFLYCLLQFWSHDLFYCEALSQNRVFNSSIISFLLARDLNIIGFCPIIMYFLFISPTLLSLRICPHCGQYANILLINISLLLIIYWVNPLLDIWLTIFTTSGAGNKIGDLSIFGTSFSEIKKTYDSFSNLNRSTALRVGEDFASGFKVAKAKVKDFGDATVKTMKQVRESSKKTVNRR